MLIHEQSKSIVFQATDPLAIRAVLPRHSMTLAPSTDGNIAVRHNIETAVVLRNMGYDCPSPIRTQYNWPGKHTPFDHQYVMCDALTMHDRVFNLSEMGTGKTYSALWAADYLMSLGLVKRAAVLAPLSTLRSVWMQDIFDILMHRRMAIVHGGLDRRQKALNLDVDFYIINHDGVALPDVAKLLRRRKDIDLIILDEASFFRNHGTDKYKFLKWVLEKKKRFWPMTGTPTPNEPADAWALCRLVNPDGVPKFKGEFKQATMVKLDKFRWAPKKGHEQIVFEAMRPAVRFLKKDCLDLPEKITIPIQTRMTPAQKKAYAQMYDDMVTSAQGTTITAVNAADKISKLRQLLCGVVKDPVSGKYKFIDHSYRVADLCQTIDQALAKVIVVVPFKGIIRSLEHELTQRKYSVACINGDVSPHLRAKIVKRFKETSDPHILLCHPKVMAHGLNLVEADMTIFYAPIYSNDDYKQVIERYDRYGQVNKMTVARMWAHPLEKQIYRQLDSKGVTQDNILSLYHNIVTQGPQ